MTENHSQTPSPSPEGGPSLEEIERLRINLTAIFPLLEGARRAYFQTPSPQTERALHELEAEAQRRNDEFTAAVDALGATLGLTKPATKGPSGDRVDRTMRASLTQDRIAPTATLDKVLPNALEGLLARAPAGWADEVGSATDLSDLLVPDSVLTLVKGMRPESELPASHRFRQLLRVARDFRDDNPAYDHFAGAMAIPTVFKLGSSLDLLDHIAGDGQRRLAHLWRGPSSEVDATAYEIVTGVRCAEMGRSVEFLPADARKSPDLRCHDPFPLVVECKRQPPFLQYELTEAQTMKALFVALRSECRRLGVFGAFELHLNTESEAISINEVTAALVGQRMAVDPSRPTAWPFGTVALRPLPGLVDMCETHRLYSPAMLAELFGWATDLPVWDGICCSISRPELASDRAREPVALLWNNDADRALLKRSWAASGLFGDATLQVPPGSFGIIYVAYLEGAREAVADLRLKRFKDKLRGFTHDAAVRIPISLINRLYPRPLGEGAPDLIESSVKIMADAYGVPELFSMFPGTVFTEPGG